jgi:hypothetical protein
MGRSGKSGKSMDGGGSAVSVFEGSPSRGLSASGMNDAAIATALERIQAEHPDLFAAVKAGTVPIAAGIRSAS